MTDASLPTRALGSLTVPAVGYGAMELGGAYDAPSDVDDAVRAITAAVDAGCTFIDTSDAYGPNERQIAAYLAHGGRRDGIQISTKFGLRPFAGSEVHRLPVPYGGGEFGINAAPGQVGAYLERSLQRLGTEYVDVYSPHFTDPEVPIEETVGALVPLVEAGRVRHAGLSNPSVDDLVRAQTVLPIAAVQVQWSSWHSIDAALLARCEATGVGVVAYSPVGRGFLTGGVTEVGGTDFRSTIDRFSGDNLASNNARFAPVRALAADLGITPAQLALAWLLHRSDVVVPIPGSRSPAHIAENAAAARVHWDAATRAQVDATLAAFTPAGTTS